MIAATLALAFVSAQADPPAPRPTLSCSRGGATRSLGGSDWHLYGCDDGKSAILVSAKGNPAGPFTFILSPGTGGYSVFGEGAGAKPASAAARDALLAMSNDAMRQMVESAGR